MAIECELRGGSFRRASGAWDVAKKGECALAVRAGEGVFCEWCGGLLRGLSKEVSDLCSGLFSSTGGEAVVTHSHEKRRRLVGVLDRSASDVPRRGEQAGGACESSLWLKYEGTNGG